MTVAITPKRPDWVQPDVLAVCSSYPNRIFRVHRLGTTKGPGALLLFDGWEQAYPVAFCRAAVPSDVLSGERFEYRGWGIPLYGVGSEDGRCILTDAEGRSRWTIQLSRFDAAVASFATFFDGAFVDLPGGDDE